MPHLITERPRLLDRFLAAQYLVGSLLFLLGGITNYLRAYLFIRDRMQQIAMNNSTP